MAEPLRSFRSVSNVSRKLVRDTVVGQLVAERYDMVDWASIDNEFACRAKVGYDENLLLDHLTAYSYDQRAVADILDSVFIKHMKGGGDRKLDTLAGYWRGGVEHERTFSITKESGVHGEFLCTLWCWSDRAATTAASLFADAFSYIGVVGVAHPADKHLYLSVHTQEDYRQVVSVIDCTGAERLRQQIHAPRLKIFTREAGAVKLVVCMPKFEKGVDLVRSVPDTFTVHADDDSKVLITDGTTLAGRRSLGCFVSTEAASKATAEMLQEYQTQELDSAIGEFYGSATIATRNVLIFSKLVEEGYVARASWADVIVEGQDSEAYLGAFE